MPEAYCQESILTCAHAGAYALLDPHNYMRYGDPSAQPNSGVVIGSDAAGAPTTEQFKEFWQEMATRFKDNEKVIFGINNEVRRSRLILFKKEN